VGEPGGPPPPDAGAERRRLLTLLFWVWIPLQIVAEFLLPDGQLLSTVVLWGLVARLVGAARRDELLGTRRPGRGWASATWGLFWPALFLSRLLLIPFGSLLPGVSPGYQLDAGNAWSVLLVVLSAPLFEELAFRGLLLELWRPEGKLPALTLTAVLFGLGHGPVAFVSSAFLGWCLGWLAWEYHSVWPSFLLHAGFNLTSVLLALTLGAVPGLDVYAAYLLAGFGLVAVAVVWLSRRRLWEVLSTPWREVERPLPAAWRGLISALRWWPISVLVALFCLSWAFMIFRPS
jgi:membrane protease YdiL (CAAX protease family)